MIFGEGINDVPGCTSEEVYKVWHSMLRRAYSKVYKAGKPTYEGVKVCEEWKNLSTFCGWFFDNYREGWQLDKDLICPSSRVYSPETCCFLPGEINMAITTSKPARGLPAGVYYKQRNSKFCAQLSVVVDGKRSSGYIGLFDSPDEARAAYELAKQKYLMKLAEKWRPELDTRAYTALKAWKLTN